MVDQFRAENVVIGKFISVRIARRTKKRFFETARSGAKLARVARSAILEIKGCVVLVAEIMVDSG